MVALKQGSDTQADFSCAMVGSTREHVRPPPSGSRLKDCMRENHILYTYSIRNLHAHASLAYNI